MRLTVLGGCGAWPAAGQACSGYLLEQDGFRLLVDPGYAVVPRLLELARGADLLLAEASFPERVPADVAGFLSSARQAGAAGQLEQARVPVGCCSPTCSRARRPARPRTRPAPASPARWGSPSAAWSPTSAEPGTPRCPGPQPPWRAAAAPGLLPLGVRDPPGDGRRGRRPAAAGRGAVRRAAAGPRPARRRGAVAEHLDEAVAVARAWEAPRWEAEALAVPRPAPRLGLTGQTRTR